MKIKRSVNGEVRITTLTEKEIRKATWEFIVKTIKPIILEKKSAKSKSGSSINGKKTIRINTHGNPVPVAKGEWVDLYTSEDVSLACGEFKIISLGVSMELPKGYYARIVPRSSTYKNYGILMTNSMGIIENSYCGDNDIWGFPALCMKEEGTYIPKGTRICQFQIEKQSEPFDFEQVRALGNKDRGGFGSTGDT